MATIRVLAVTAFVAASAFQADAARAVDVLTVLYTFTGGADSASPAAGPTFYNGALYGTTTGGGYGAAPVGTLYRLDPKTGSQTALHTFTGGQGGSVDGAGPTTQVVVNKGVIYGTTSGGGQFGYGTLFQFDLSSGSEKVLYNFPPDANASGVGPLGVTFVGGHLYGTTRYDGKSALGTVIGFDLKTGKERTLHNFQGGSDGATPLAAVTSVGGVLYGTTVSGGTSNVGTVFQLDPRSGKESVVYSFAGGTLDGEHPQSAPTYDGHFLYGTTAGGGSAGYGVIYRIDLKTGIETVVHNFLDQADGADVGAITSFGGKLYGTAAFGGAYQFGNIFSFDSATDKETVLCSFDGNGTDGQHPRSGLATDGNSFYAATAGGGYADGTISKCGH